MSGRGMSPHQGGVGWGKTAALEPGQGSGDGSPEGAPAWATRQGSRGRGHAAGVTRHGPYPFVSGRLANEAPLWPPAWPPAWPPLSWHGIRRREAACGGGGVEIVRTTGLVVERAGDVSRGVVARQRRWRDTAAASSPAVGGCGVACPLSHSRRGDFSNHEVASLKKWRISCFGDKWDRSARESPA